MKMLLVTLLALLLALPAMADPEGLATRRGAGDGAPARQEAAPGPAAQAPAERGTQPAEAPPVDDVIEPAWDDTIQQAAGEQNPDDGQDAFDPDAIDPDATLPPVLSVVMKLVEQEKPLSGVKVGIDPGHQARGNNQKETVAPNSKKTKPKVSSGTAGVKTRIPEYKTVLEISLKLREALEEQGAEVYMTRETHDVDISNQERAKMMNALGVDVVLRIHCDGVDNHSKHGIAVYCSRSNGIAAESYRACEAILPAVCAATGAQNNGIVSNDNYTGQNWSTVPCLMVECGFDSNPEEDVLLNSEDYQWKLAEGLTQGIVDYIARRDGGE